MLEVERRQRALDAERLALLAEWGRSGEWADDGSISPAVRLACVAGIQRRVARQQTHLSELLATSMPLTRAAFESLGIDKARLLAGAINPRTAEHFARDEAVLVEQAIRLSADQLAVLLRHWRWLVDEDGANADADSRHDGEYLELVTSFDGQVLVKGRFGPESGAILRSVLEQIGDELYRSARRAAVEAKLRGEDPLPAMAGAQRTALAAVEMARRAAATTTAEAGGATVVPARPLVQVVIDAEQLGESIRIVRARLADGTALSTIEAARMACDAVVARVLVKDGVVPLQLGRSRRDPSEAQRRALSSIWSTCAHPTCDRPFAWCQLHHVWHWELGGPTDIEWLLPLCSRHHHLHHAGVFAIERRPDGTFSFTHADGTDIGPANPTVSQILGNLRDLARTWAA